MYLYGRYPSISSIRFRLGGMTKVVAHETHVPERLVGFESKTEEVVRNYPTGRGGSAVAEIRSQIVDSACTA